MAEFFNFNKLISATIIKILYVLGLIGITITGILMAQDEDTVLAGIGLVILGNLVWRVICENIILMFSLHKNVAAINNTISGISSVSTKILFSKVENHDLYINEKAFDPKSKNYIGKITKVDVENEKCTIKKDSGVDFGKGINEIMVNEL